MNFNKYFIFIIFLALILSVSAVDAADNLDTNDNSISTKEAIFSASTTVNKNWTVDEFLNNYNAIQDNDVVLIQNGVGIPTGNIVLNQSGITIFTEGNVIFDCQRKNFYFEINGKNVLIQGIDFQNFNSGNVGGAIKWNGDNGTLTGCKFINNTADFGGAVSWRANNGTITNCKFINNSGTYGGAVYWDAMFGDSYITWFGVVGIADSIFINNSASSGGGAVYGYGVVGIVDSIFINNTAVMGGAVDWHGDKGTITNCKFINNSEGNGGGGNGGAILWEADDGTLTNCQFINNSANMGGGIFWTKARGTITNCIFTNNRATYGGGIYLERSVTNCRLSGCNFTGNFGVNEGGGVYWHAADGTLIDCRFINNRGNEGSGIFWNADNGNLINSTFTNNSANYGAGIHWSGNNGRVSGCTFNNNHANSGGGVYWNSMGGNFINSTFTNNTATSGGAIYLSAVASLINCSFINSEWIKSNGIYARNNLNIQGGNGIVDIVTSGMISGISLIVLDNETYCLTPNQTINITGKIMSGNLTIVDNMNGVFKFYLDGVEFTASNIQISNKGEYFIPYASNTPATLVVSASYGKSGSTSKCRNATLIFKYDSDLKVAVENITFGDNATVVVTSNSNVTGKVNVTLNGTNYEVEIIDGKGTLVLSNLATGNYKVIVSYNWDDEFYAATAVTDFTVSKTAPEYVLDANDVVKYFRNETQYHVSLKDIYGNPLVGERITVTLVNGRHTNPVQYVIITDSNGVATLVINANPGTYYATAVYGNQSVTNTITVLASGYSIDAQDIFMTFKDGTIYTARLTYSEGTPVSNVYMSIFLKTKSSGKTYKILTDGNGVATLPINLNPGQYTMTAEYMGEAVTTRLVVLSGSHIIMAEDIVKYFKNGTQYTVKVTDLDGNPVSGQKVEVKLNSATWSKQAYYNITTDGNGIATLAINLSPGQYTAEAKIGSGTVQSKIIVLPTLTSDNLIKPVNQPGNLVAKLVDGQGNPASGKTVTFTVKTKTYTKTTDSNGLASLPINLGVGNWKIDIVNPETGAKATAKVFISKAKI